MSCKQDKALDAIADAYRNGVGVSELARKTGRSRNAIYDILHARHVELKPCTANGRKPRNELTSYKGLCYTWTRKGFWRCTTGDRHNLAWRIYEDHYGRKPVPGEEVWFRDGNYRNLKPGNLVCQTRSMRQIDRLKDPSYRAFVLATGTYARLNKAIQDELDPTRKAAFARRMWETRNEKGRAAVSESANKAWETRRQRYGESGVKDLAAHQRKLSLAHTKNRKDL